jgi:regulator of replication initiation timing
MEQVLSIEQLVYINKLEESQRNFSSQVASLLKENAELKQTNENLVSENYAIKANLERKTGQVSRRNMQIKALENQLHQKSFISLGNGFCIEK